MKTSEAVPTHRNMLSIIIPAHNAGGMIAKTIDDYITYFVEVYGQALEIIVVPNGCSDKTLDIVSEYCDRFPMIRTKAFKERIGKGGAVMEGLRLARGDIIAFVDADGATGPGELLGLVDRLGDNGAVIGSRWLPESRVLVKQPLLRRIASRGFNLLVRMLFGLPFKDTQCGAKVLNRRAVDDVLKELETTNFAFDVELLYKLKREGYNIEEVPIIWEDKPLSTLNLWREIPKMLFAVLRLRLLNSPFRWMVQFATL